MIAGKMKGQDDVHEQNTVWWRMNTVYLGHCPGCGYTVYFMAYLADPLYNTDGIQGPATEDDVFDPRYISPVKIKSRRER